MTSMGLRFSDESLPLAYDRLFTTGPRGWSTSSSQHHDETVRAHLKSAGPGHVRLHDLGHTYGSLLMGQGVPLKTISDLMGHASIEVTADMYLHSLDAADSYSFQFREGSIRRQRARRCP
jgi:integrase